MEKNQQGQVALIVFIVLLLFVVGWVFFSMSNRQQISSILPENGNERNKADINWDEKIDITDADLLKPYLNCKKNDACWQKVIGKTVTGDNPIYVYDGDLSGDGVIDQKDVEMIK
jgi:hypothetical protein